MIQEAPSAFVFMKVGSHAGESFESILARKKKERETTGRTFWGYGGSACHPIKQVQPFARSQLRKHGSVYLLMEYVDSRADPDILPATEYSTDGVNWEPISEGAIVTGSRFALVFDEITPADFEVQPDAFEVGIGPSRGKSAAQYLRGRVDKACLTLSERQAAIEPMPGRRVSYVARLQEPFAVLLR